MNKWQKVLAAGIVGLGIPFTLGVLQNGDLGFVAVGGNWRGLNNGDASLSIGDNEAQDLLNVDITERAFGVKKRAGYSQFRTIGFSTKSVRGGYYYRDLTGVDNTIHTNNTSIYYSTNSAAYTAIVTTDTVDSYYDFTDSNGRLYRATNNRDEFVQISTANKTYFPSLPKGNQVEATPDRLVLSGTSANPNRVHFSAAADFTNFTTGTEDTDPFTEDIGLPGQAVTSIKWFNEKLLIWTKTSLSYWYGTNQFDGVIQSISNTVGTKQPYSVVDDLGVTYFQGQDRHFYATDSNGLTKISSALNVSNFRGKDDNSWTQTTQADFTAQTLDTRTTASAYPGAISLTTGTLVDNFTDGSFATSPVWSTFTALGTGATVSASNGYFSFTHASGASASTAVGYTTLSQSTGSWVFTFAYPSASSSGTFDFTFQLCAANPTDYITSACYTLEFAQSGATTNILFWGNGSQIGSTFTGARYLSDGATHKIEVNRNSSGVFKVYIDDILQTSFTDTTFANFQRIAVGTSRALAGAGTEGRFDDFYFFPSTGTAFLKFNVGSGITAYGPIRLDGTLSGLGDSITYGFYEHNSSAISSMTFTSSQTITNGAIPSIGINSWVGISAQFVRVVSTENPTVNETVFNWFESGIGIPTFGAVDKDHRIMWSLAEGTSTVPNATYIYDPKFDTWLKYSVPFQAAARVGDSLYFGGVSTGVVYQWPSGNTDNGSAITAYWKSKDFISGDPFVEKLYKSISLVPKAQTGSNLDVTWTMNTSTASSYNISLTDANGNSYVRNNYRLPSGKFGTFFNLKFGNDDGDAPFEVYTFKYEYEPKPWRVMP